MTFSAALELLKEGYAVKRSDWRDSDYIELTSDDESMNSYLVLYAVGVEPWNPMHNDLLADDWQIVELTDETTE